MLKNFILNAEELSQISVETLLLFGSVLIAFLTVIVTSVSNIIQHHQNASLNTINLFQKHLENTFVDNLIKGFDLSVSLCNYKEIDDSSKLWSKKVAYDNFHLVALGNRITAFLGEIDCLKYATPIRYYFLNRKGTKIVEYIEEKMLPYAKYCEGSINNDLNLTSLPERKAKIISARFLKLIKRFYKKAFKLYKYGL